MVELVMTGRKSVQQQMWECIRHKVAGAFHEHDLSQATGIDLGVVRNYLSRLVKGDVLQFDGAQFKLLRDVGAEAPNLNPDGTEDVSDRPYEAIWRVLRIMGDTTLEGAMDTCQTAGVPTGKTQVQRYLNALTSAGYLHRSREGVYRLLPGHWTGPFFPRLTRIEVLALVDQNDDRVVWSRGDAAVPKVQELAAENEQLRRVLAAWSELGQQLPTGFVRAEDVGKLQRDTAEAMA